MTACSFRPCLAAHSWSFPALDLTTACLHAAALGYQGLDLGSGDLGLAAGLDVPTVTADDTFPDRARRAARDAGIIYTDYFVALPHPVNDADTARVAENSKVFRTLAPRLHAAEIPGVTYSPGFYNGRSWEEAFSCAASALRELVAIAGADLLVRIEPHVESVTDTPTRTLALLAEVPGLTLTLDYSHFVVAGFDQDTIEPLTRHASHVHLRQARAGELATEVDRGTIDLRRLISRLRTEDYRGALTIEYVSHSWHGQDRIDTNVANAAMLAQTREILDEIEVQP